jgi:hypothetical protein
MISLRVSAVANVVGVADGKADSVVLAEKEGGPVPEGKGKLRVRKEPRLSGKRVSSSAV